MTVPEPRRARRSDRRGYFGVAVHRPKRAANVGSLWRSASVYGASFLATVAHRYERQPSDTELSALHTPLLHFADTGDLLGHLPFSCPLVGVELDERARPLDTFTHPERALYLLGAEDDGLPGPVLDRCHFVVSIPTWAPRSMNVACAGAILLYDRYRQRGAVSSDPRVLLTQPGGQ